MAKIKDLQYYLSLNYEVRIKKIEDDGKFHYKATINELDDNVFYGVGETPQESLDSLSDVKEEMFAYYLEKGLNIAEPEPEEEVLPSGKFMVRIPPKLHANLIKKAKSQKQSLNAYINHILSMQYSKDLLLDAWKEFADSYKVDAFKMMRNYFYFIYSEQSSTRRTRKELERIKHENPEAAYTQAA